MALVLLRLIDMATFLVFRIAAMFIVALLQLLKVPSYAGSGVVERIGDAFKSAGECATGLAVDILTSAVLSFFELIGSAATGSVELASSAIGELLEMSKAGLEELAEIFAQVIGGAAEVVGNLILGLWNKLHGCSRICHGECLKVFLRDR